MRVRDLRRILEMLPEDMLVLIDGTYHVTTVTKAQRRTIPGVPLADPPVPDQVAPACIILGRANRYIGVRWYDPEPSFALEGRWPRPRMTGDDLDAARKLLRGGK